MFDFREIVRRAQNHLATDLHLTVGTAPVFRIDGSLHTDECDAPLTEQDVMSAVRLLTPEKELQELEQPSAGHVERFDASAAIAAADGLMADYDGVLAGMKRKSDALTKAAGENERLLLELLEQK